MMMLTKQQNKFYNCEELTKYETELVEFYARCFTNGNVVEAQKIIKFDASDQIRKKDLKVISITFGALTVLVP